MNYAEAEQFLFSLNAVARREYLKSPRAAGVYLQRLGFLLKLLRNPEKKIPHYVHVTGTSGKGSVAIMMARVLERSGHTTGLVTSPGIDPLLTRFEVNGQSISRSELAKHTERIKTTLEHYIRVSPYDLPSYFEVLTALGFLFFAARRVSFAVLEVYLGGRNDATNIIPHKDAAIITNIGLDHVALIGPTKTDIAREKIGIVTGPTKFFTAEKNPKLRAIFSAECTRRRATFTQVSVPRQTHADEQGAFNFAGGTYHLPPGLGQHQVSNAALVISAARALGIPERAIQRGLGSVRLPLRFETIQQTPRIILDGAHNPDKIKSTVAAIRALAQQTPGRRKHGAIHLLIGFSADKAIARMLRLLMNLNPRSVACTRFSQNLFRKAASPMELARQIRASWPGRTIEPFLDPLVALAWSKRKLKKNDLLVVTGSLFLASELRAALGKKN